jgi:coronin-1B/1C/6
LTWLGDSQNLLSCGFSKLSEREYAVWDVRNFTTPVVRRQLDTYNGVPFSYFDEEHKAVFVAGKGESAITYFQYNPTSPNMLEIQGAFKGKEPQKGFSFLPKKILDTSINEVAKGVRLTNKTIEYVSFRVPRKAGGFQSDLYPPIRSSEAAMTAEDYLSG